MKKTVKIDSNLHQRLAIVARLCNQTIEEFAEAGIVKEVELAEHRTKEQSA